VKYTRVEGVLSPKHREPKEDDKDKFASIYCPACNLLITPDSAEDQAEMESVVSFIAQHQSHGEVFLMVEEEDGSWESTGSLVFPH
jgi:hypothetical protein